MSGIDPLKLNLHVLYEDNSFLHQLGNSILIFRCTGPYDQESAIYIFLNCHLLFPVKARIVKNEKNKNGNHRKIINIIREILITFLI